MSNGTTRGSRSHPESSAICRGVVDDEAASDGRPTRTSPITSDRRLFVEGRRYYERSLRSTIHESDPGEQGQLHKGVRGLRKMGRTVREGGHDHDPRRFDRG